MVYRIDCSVSCLVFFPVDLRGIVTCLTRRTLVRSIHAWLNC